MDQHPIPQDVTGFQFKLIGSMTVKQFGFVAVGVILAVILYYLPSQVGSWQWILKSLLIVPAGVSGVIIAFVPIEGRPADVMATNFAKALFSPNQYVYRRQGRQFSFSKIADIKVQTAQQVAAEKTAHEARLQRTSDSRGARLEAFLINSSQSQVRNSLDEKEMAFYKNISAISGPLSSPSSAVAGPILPQANVPHVAPMVASAAPIMTPPALSHAAPQPPPSLPTPPAAPVPTPSISPDVAAPTSATTLSPEEQLLEQQLNAAKLEEAKTPPTAAAGAHLKVLELEKKIQEIHQQKQQIDKELTQAKAQLATIQQAPVSPPVVTPPSTAAVSTQPPLPNPDLPHVSDTPNVVVGIVRDPRGNNLSNILVEIKDKDGNPVRAFKTNPLGHFASATPLAAGTYTIELEDPKKLNSFDPIQLTASNQILLPLEIVSHDAREELRKQLFN
jgi:hypothetical protein